MTLDQKYDILNKACRLTVPISKYQNIIEETKAKSNKYQPTRYDEIHLSEPNEGKDGTIAAKKKQQLDDIKFEGDWDVPEDISDPHAIEDTTAVVPLEYYDNDDGYWDDYIAFKNKLRSKVPLPRYRHYLKH